MAVRVYIVRMNLRLIERQTILITIITQGARVPADLKGNLKGSLFFRSRVVDAIGTIAL